MTKEFSTSDMTLCAYLYIEGFSHIRVEVIREAEYDAETDHWEAGLSEMVFKRDEQFDDAVMDYQTGNAKVEPREFIRRVTFVRSTLINASRPRRVGK